MRFSLGRNLYCDVSRSKMTRVVLTVLEGVLIMKGRQDHVDWLLISFTSFIQHSSWQNSTLLKCNSELNHSRNRPQDKPSASRWRDVAGLRPLHTCWAAVTEIKKCIRRAGKNLTETENWHREGTVSWCWTLRIITLKTYNQHRCLLPVVSLKAWKSLSERRAQVSAQFCKTPCSKRAGVQHRWRIHWGCPTWVLPGQYGTQCKVKHTCISCDWLQMQMTQDTCTYGIAQLH